jgi:hypothetical protein
MDDTPTNPTYSRAWFDATLDDLHDRLQRAEDAGAALALSYTDDQGVAILASVHGAGLTLKATPASGQDPLEVTLPRAYTLPRT